ncbi:MAG: sensor domain-containing diguanylate cyclase [Legionellaceae bacterium]|nr:sensor domain-containing diguanylate cyclase [Legionellaceae bacterium]
MIEKNAFSNPQLQWNFSFLMSKEFSHFLHLIPDAAILSTESGQIILTNQTAQTLFGYTETEFLQVNIEDLVPESIRAVHPTLRATFFENPEPRLLKSRNLKLTAQKKDKSLFPMESALFAIQTDKGPIAVNLLRDISIQKAHEEKITRYAFVDTLTNLPNRRYFDDNIKRIASKVRRDNTTLGILYIDIDAFKPINDTYGHEAGDLVLRTIAARLSKLLRKEDFLCRIGGDEFILIIHPIPETYYLETIAERILTACNQLIPFNEHSFHVSASIGISFNDSSQFDEQILIKNADKAMYLAKKQGGNCFKHAPK